MANRRHIQLSVEQHQFNGYDHASNRHFSGEVRDNRSISLFDYESGRYFQYSVS